MSQVQVESFIPRDSPRSIDQLIRRGHERDPGRIAVVFPSADEAPKEYSTRDIDVLAYTAASHYAQRLNARTSSQSEPDVVALLGVPDFNYLITLLALAKLGHATLLLSPRLSVNAYRHLLRESKAKLIVAQTTFDETVTAVTSSLPSLLTDTFVDAGSMLNANSKGSLTAQETCLTPNLELESEYDKPVWILHSSGSTGLPKLVYIKNRSAFGRYHHNLKFFGGKDTFTTLPIFHAHGMSSFFRAILTESLIHVYNPHVPITLDRLKRVTANHRFQLFSAVPYVIKLLAETPEGVEFLRQFELVTSGGGPVPENLGDMLVEQGVRLTSIYGSSETGNLLTSARPVTDKEWSYLRPPEGYGHLLRFEHQGGGLHELVAPKDWPEISESNQPDGSWRTKDLFIKHSSKSNTWKYVGRLDDVIVLENGEKTNPVDVEGRISKHPLVDVSVVFGSGRSALGLAVVRSAAAELLTEEKLAMELWPHIEAAQESLPAYAKLSPEMILILPAGSPCPKTDKGTIIRRKFYQEHADKIDALYQESDQAQDLKTMNESELSHWIAAELALILGERAEDFKNDTDLFASGMDSLQASRLRNAILRTVDLRGHKLSTNIVFNYPTIGSLSAQLTRVASGGGEVALSSLNKDVENMIEKYSSFEQHIPGITSSQGEVVVLTGATGSLGAHLLSRLLRTSGVAKVYCLVRAKSEQDARQRIASSLQERKISTSLLDDTARLAIWPSSLSDVTLGLTQAQYAVVSESATSVFHCGWTVNFNQRLQSFEKDNVRGLHNLINVCMKSKQRSPAQMVFFSSISTIIRSEQTPLPEEVPKAISQAQAMGYAHSKYVAEHLCKRAAERQRGFHAKIIRIGQIIGDTVHGIWNVSEATPLMLQSAVTIGSLPQLDEQLRWLPVDQVAQISVELAALPEVVRNGHHRSPPTGGPCTVYNLVNPYTLHWTRDLLPTLHQLGLKFNEALPTEWCKHLQESSQDPEANPPAKLLEYYSRQCASNAPRPVFIWDSTNTTMHSPTFRQVTPPSKELIATILRFLSSKWTPAVAVPNGPVHT